MPNRLTLLAVAIFPVLALSSCQKNLSVEKLPNIITGTWDYVSATATTSSTASFSDVTGSYATVTLANYTTQDNTGTVVITPDSMISRDLGYTINDNATAYVYMNNTLTDSTTLPFNYTLSPTSSSAAYQLIGSDSLYFPNGAPVGAPTGGSTGGVGARFTLSNGTLVMTTHFSQTTTQTMFGIQVKEVDQAIVTTTLKKH